MLRVTTQMLNETARKTGIPINQPSLLSYLNETENSNSPLLDALNKNSKVSSATAENYKKLESAADKLKAAAEKLTSDKENSLYDKARESGDNSELYASVKTFLENYNSTLSALKKSASPINSYYSEMLLEAAGENASLLNSIGITINKDGSLSADSEKLENASADDIEKVFGSGTLSSKTAFIAGRASNNAQAGAQSVSSQYDIFGNLYSQTSSKYNFWS